MNTAKQQTNLWQQQHIWHHQEGVQFALKFEISHIDAVKLKNTRFLVVLKVL
jgi:hypothetical protein